jgi:hypothetical protein
MKSSDLKVVAIILSIALFFTIITSNAVSIASVVILAKGGSGTTVVQDGTATTPGGTTSTTPGGTVSTTPGGTTSTTPGGTTSTTPGGTTSTTPGGTTATTPDGTTQQGGTTQTTPDANKPDGDNKPAGQTKSAKECLEIYTKVMNKAKADKPAYTKVEYQELPSDANSRVISEGEGLVGTLLNLVDSLGIMTSKEAAEAEPEVKEAGSDMRWFPVYKCEKGCYLTDVSAIKSYKYEDLGNDQAKVTIVLNDEQNPEPMAEGASSSPSNTGAMFSPLAKADIDNTINGGAVQAVIKNVTFSLTYHDCTAIIVYNTKTNELVSVEQYMNVAIQGAGKIMGIKQITIDKQELINTVRITDFKY